MPKVGSKVCNSHGAGRSKEPLSDLALQMVSARFKALGDVTRLKLVQILSSGEKSVLELADLTHTSQANVSKHLSILSERGILARRKDGLFVHYRVADQTVHSLCALVCKSLSAGLSMAEEASKTGFRKVRQ
jgi:DNA-binding transcriptional ArsR family regulator